jgi:hypothetical protein
MSFFGGRGIVEWVVFRGVLARKNRIPLVGSLFALLLTGGACGDDSTRVRLLFTVDEPAFRPDSIDLIWGVVGGDQRTARIPASGSLPMDGDVGSVLIILDEAQQQPRRFIARGKRGDERVSGQVATVPWNSGNETAVTMKLGCYDDPGIPEAVAGCRAGNGNGSGAGSSDGGAGPDSQASASGPQGRD